MFVAGMAALLMTTNRKIAEAVIGRVAVFVMNVLPVPLLHLSSPLHYTPRLHPTAPSLYLRRFGLIPLLRLLVLAGVGAHHHSSRI